MLKQIFRALLVTCVVTGTLLAATDPFVGKWKLNQAKSKISGDELKIQALGGNKYTITFGDISDTLVADGTQQPVHFGRTQSITPQGATTWKVVEKQGDRTLNTAMWTLSKDGKTLNIVATGKRPDGSTFNAHFSARRLAGTSGFAGTWERTNTKIAAPPVWEIRPYDGNGLSFVTPSEHEHQDLKFDGKDYPDLGPNVPAGSMASGKRVDERTLEVTDKIKGKVVGTVRYQLSSDHNTLTLTVHNAGQSHPLTIVFDRQ
jgi:hypothetical protein